MKFKLRNFKFHQRRSSVLKITATKEKLESIDTKSWLGNRGKDIRLLYQHIKDFRTCSRGLVVVT